MRLFRHFRQQMISQPGQLQMSLHPRQQLLALKRLADKIHRAQLESLHSVIQVAQATKKDHRNRLRRRILFKPAADFKTVHLRHLHIE